MRVDDEIAHMGVIHRRLRLGLPGRMGGGIAWESADKVDLFEVAEGDVSDILQLAADHQVQQLFGHRFSS